MKGDVDVSIRKATLPARSQDEMQNIKLPRTHRTHTEKFLLLKATRPLRCAPHQIAGWSSPVARQAHNLKVAGSNPAPATTFKLLKVPLVQRFAPQLKHPVDPHANNGVCPDF